MYVGTYITKCTNHESIADPTGERGTASALGEVCSGAAWEGCGVPADNLLSSELCSYAALGV